MRVEWVCKFWLLLGPPTLPWQGLSTESPWLLQVVGGKFSSLPGLANTFLGKIKQTSTTSLPPSERVRSDSPKPHCQQGGGSERLTHNAFLLQGWGRKLSSKLDPTDTTLALSQSTASFRPEGNGRSAPCSVLLTLPSRGIEVHCLLPRQRMKDQPTSCWGQLKWWG